MSCSTSYFYDDSLRFTFAQAKLYDLPLQLSTPKPEVPEVSLMFDSDDSLIWQVSRPRSLKEKEQSFESYAKQDKMQFSSQSRMAISAQTPVTEDVINATEKKDYNINSILRRPQVASVPCAPFPRGEKQMTEDVTSETRATERKFQDLQMNKPCDVIAPPFTHTGSTGHVNERQYNPKVYSPAQEVVTNKASTDDDSHGMRQKDSPLTNYVISGAQQHPARTENFISPQARPVCDVSPHIFNSRPATPPVMKRVMFSQDNISNSPVETESDNANKTNAFHVDSCLPQSQNKKENIHPSFPADQQLRIPMDSRACFSENVSNHYYSPTSISHPAQASQFNHTLQDKRYNSLVKQGVYPEPYSYSPHSFNGRLYSPPDPMVYRLIEDQSQQILKLTKTIERIVEKQQEDKSPKDVSLRELANSKVMHSMEGDEDQANLHKDISTQTLATSMPEKRCVGVNTDLSWPDLIASIRDCNTCEVRDHWGFNSVERTKATKEIKSNDMNRNSPRENVDPEKCQSKQKLSLDRRNSAFQGIMSESPRQEGTSMTEEDVMLAAQEEQPRSHPSLPIGMPQYYDNRVPEKLAGHLR